MPAGSNAALDAEQVQFSSLMREGWMNRQPKIEKDESVHHEYPPKPMMPSEMY